MDHGPVWALMTRYCETFDGGRVDEFAALFERGRLHFERMADLRGADEVTRFIDERVFLYDGRPATSHQLANTRIDPAGPGRATASSYVAVYQALADFPLQVIATARYVDRFVEEDGA